MESNLPHLFLKKPPEQSTFTSTPQRGKERNIPLQNRQQHGAYLNSKLQEAWQKSVDESIVYHTTRSGVYLEFKSHPNIELVTRSLEEMKSKKIRLLNIRESDTSAVNPLTGVIENEKITFATVYVANEKKEYFFNKIKQYAKNDLKESGKPQNADFINSINNIRKALLVESFWLDLKGLIPKEKPEWCEVWLSSDKDDVLKQFTDMLEKLQIQSKAGFIRFPERMVKVILADRSQLEQLTRLSDDIAEYRRAKVTARFWSELPNKDQVEWVEDILNRLKTNPNSEVSVCLLDTGVNNGHPLIKPVLNNKNCQCVDPDWGSHDHDKHGTLMAGISAYGDLQTVLSHKATIRLNHLLESVKILPPKGNNKVEVWGYITSQGIAKAEIQSPDRKRISCMAITAEDTRGRGRPSSWSAALDQLCSGAEDGIQRLLVVCAGNTTDFTANYPDAQLSNSIHDPAQSWNALTVGAYTTMDTITDPTLSEYLPIAPAKGLSPYTTTSLTWEDKWPIKPEIVMEGGNLAKNMSGFSTECDDLSVLSTFYHPQDSHFYPFGMTSVATAKAAWFAAQIQIKYPDYWPETIRALMVHSAEWTDTLIEQFGVDLRRKGEIGRLMRICGYGVPDLNRAMYCASNSLTLIAQSELQPFDKKEGESSYRTQDMHLHNLPWPKEILLNLPSETEIQMRVTLSYFIEPGPGEIGWQDRYRYASCGLRFDINSPDESKDEFERRINTAARDKENGHPGTSSASDLWMIGSKVRDKGSIHSDIWKGSAAQLAGSSFLAVFPRIGWWRQRAYLGKWGKKIRYALVVSISAPQVTMDIYTEVANIIGITIPIEVST